MNWSKRNLFRSVDCQQSGEGAGTDDEMLFHIDMQTDVHVRQGMDPQEARRQAMILFGGVERTRQTKLSRSQQRK